MFNEFDKFDIAIALYHWLQHNWVGMDDKYKAFCQLTKPRMLEVRGSLQYFEKIDDNMKEVYDMINDNNYQEALNIVLNEKE